MKVHLRVFDAYGDNLTRSPLVFDARRRSSGNYRFYLGHVALVDSSPISGFMLVRVKTKRVVKRVMFTPSREPSMIDGHCSVHLGWVYVNDTELFFPLNAENPTSP